MMILKANKSLPTAVAEVGRLAHRAMRKMLSLILGSLLLCSTAFSAADLTLTLDIQKDDLQDVLHAYGKLTGLQLVKSSEVETMHTLIIVHPDHPVTIKEAITLIEDAVKDQAGVVIKRLDDKKASATLAKK
jgi:predicted hydrocarbon binding protein